MCFCPLCVLFLWSPFSLSLPLCWHRLGLKSSSEIHPQSLKFPPADFLGQWGTRFNQSWDKSWLTDDTPVCSSAPPHHLRYSLILPCSPSYLPVGNREQDVWIYILLQKTLCFSRWMYRWTQMDTVSSQSSRDWIWFGRVCVCLLVYNTMHSIECAMRSVRVLALFFRSFFSQPGLPRMQPGGLLSLPSWEREGGKEEKRGQSRDYECVCGRESVSAPNVCLCGKRSTEGGKKIYLTCWQSSIFQIQQQGKNNMPGYLPATKPAPPFIYGKQKQHCQ